MKYNTQRRTQRQGDRDSYIVAEMGTCIYTETHRETDTWKGRCRETDTQTELEKRQRHAYRDTHRQKARRQRTFITFSVHPVPGLPGCEWQASPWAMGDGGARWDTAYCVSRAGESLCRTPSPELFWVCFVDTTSDSQRSSSLCPSPPPPQVPG